MCGTDVKSVETLTCGQKILLQIGQFGLMRESMVMPFGLCQDGIADATGMTRSHVSLELKKLMDKDIIETRKAHITEGKIIRNVYGLTLKGAIVFDTIRENLRELGVVDLETIFVKHVGKMPTRSGNFDRAEIELDKALELLKMVGTRREKDEVANISRHVILALEALSREACI